MKLCADCGKRFEPNTTARRCWRCADHAFMWQQYATAKVQYAVKKGRLPKADTLPCAFCGEPASGYEHDDYGFPLAVKPICRVCNWHRVPYVPREPSPYKERL